MCVNVCVFSSYPYAVVGIHMIEMVHGWLRDSQLNAHLYASCQQWPLSTEDIMEIYCEDLCVCVCVVCVCVLCVGVCMNHLAVI